MPLTYQAAAYYVNPDKDYAVKVSRFDENLLSADGELIIHIGGNTVILQANGDAFIGGADALAGRALVVLYTVTTKGIPPQTTPEKVFVLYEQAVPLPGLITDECILVNGMEIEAPATYYKGAVLMVPLRAIAEALGYEVIWEGATRSVYLNNVISLTIGKDDYTIGRMAPLQLGTAPEIVDGRTYVPLSFFKQVVRAKRVNVQDGVIEISVLSNVDVVVSGEKVEAPAPYFNGSMLMVPLRAIAEALEYEVIWEGATRSVSLNNVISLTIGKDGYTVGKMAPIELGTAPEIVDGLTYVPLSFFKQVVGMNNAYYFEGVIEINNDEVME